VRLAALLGVPHISTGDLFRANLAASTPLGVEAKRYMDAGELVPDQVTVAMVRERLIEPDAADGFILDGFPRTAAQAEDLHRILADRRWELDAVVELVVPDDVVVARLLARGRADDTEEVICRRQRVYWEATTPLLDYCRDLLMVSVDAVGTVEDVLQRMLDVLPSPRTAERPASEIADVR
jgi:adenylate kinase